MNEPAAHSLSATTGVPDLSSGGLQVDAQADQLALLAAMGRDFAESLDIDETLLKAVIRITDHLDAAGGALFLLNEAGDRLRCHACYGATEITGLELPADAGIVGRCVQERRPEIVRDVEKDPNFHGGVDEQTGFKTKSILCAVLSHQDKCIGAIELVNKLNQDELFSPAELNILQALASSAALAILNARMAEALVEQERVRRELELAAEIQRTLLPDEQDSDYPVHGFNQPARECSGDFFDFFELPDGRICFNLGDVSGKGLNAAMLMAKTASIFRVLGKTIHDPAQLLTRVNAEICETAARGMFVTMVGGLYDPRTGKVRIANAGHEPPLFRHTDGTLQEIEASAPPIGISADLVTPEMLIVEEIDLRGGALYTFTDGLTEGYLENGDMLGTEGMHERIHSYADNALPGRLTDILAILNRPDATLHDDLTILVIDDRGPATSRTTDEVAPGEHDDALEQVSLLAIPARPSRLKLIRALVSTAVKSKGGSEHDINDCVLAIDEACQNIIRHAYGGPCDDVIELDIRFDESRRDGGALIFRLADLAPPIDVAKVKPRDIEDVRPGGLGTHLIREVMDRVDFLPTPSDGGNLLRLVKNLTTKSAP
ncbi:MAG: ATP-binding SpoIIE family protein phosphatase [Magnetovibrionaceae bacterium]